MAPARQAEAWRGGPRAEFRGGEAEAREVHFVGSLSGEEGGRGGRPLRRVPVRVRGQIVDTTTCIRIQVFTRVGDRTLTSKFSHARSPSLKPPTSADKPTARLALPSDMPLEILQLTPPSLADSVVTSQACRETYTTLRNIHVGKRVQAAALEMLVGILRARAGESWSIPAPEKAKRSAAGSEKEVSEPGDGAEIVHTNRQEQNVKSNSISTAQVAIPIQDNQPPSLALPSTLA